MKTVRRMTIAVGTLLSAVSCAGTREAVLSPPTAVSPGRGTAAVPASPTASPILGIQAPRIPDRGCPLTDHGARGDGTTNDSVAINQAIAACHRAGGGTIRFPPGTYRVASIRLLSRVLPVRPKDSKWLTDLIAELLLRSGDPEALQAVRQWRQSQA